MANKPIIIGLSGGTASGKTTVSRAVIEELSTCDGVCELVSMDMFYRPLTSAQIEAAHNDNYNFDHPNAIDFELLTTTLNAIVAGEPVDIPLYDFGAHNRVGVEKRIEDADVIVFEGIFALYDEAIRSLMDLKVFVDSDSDTRLARRVRRDMASRDRTLVSVLDQYEKYVKPAFDVYIAPTKRYADIILPGQNNDVGIDLIALHIRMKLEQKKASQAKA